MVDKIKQREIKQMKKTVKDYRVEIEDGTIYKKVLWLYGRSGTPVLMANKEESGWEWSALAADYRPDYKAFVKKWVAVNLEGVKIRDGI